MKKILLALLIGLIAAQSHSFAEARKLKLALNWVPEPEFGGFYLAKWEGLYGAKGLDVDILIGGAGSPTIQMIGAKKVEFGLTSGGEVILARSRGAKVKAVFSVYQKSPLMIMAHASRKLKSLGEVFQSGTVSLERGLAFASFLERKFGFSKVKIVPYAGGVANFLHDPLFAQQGFATSEPILAQNAGSDPQVFLIADEGFDHYMETLTVHDDLIQKDGKLVKDFVDASREGWERYLKDPTKTNEKMAALNKAMDLKTFKIAANLQKPFVLDKLSKESPLGSMSESRWTEQATQLKDLKQVDKIFPASDYFKNF